jgi:hypothetical protein
MTYEQIWNTVEDLFNQNLTLAREANKFFGIVNYEADEITTQDGLIIKRKRKVPQENKRREVLYQVSMTTKSVDFRIGREDGESRHTHKYYFDIPTAPRKKSPILCQNAIGTMILDESVDMKHFIKYVRDWKLKNLLD